jgi:SAM-dependent methyltransferase
LRFDNRRDERALARAVAAREHDSGAVDGIPVPPPLLRVQVTGVRAERDAWLAAGATDAELIGELVSRHGIPIEQMGAVLDFGCGCGRVARYWAQLPGPEIHGADVSRNGIRWCRRNLSFMQAIRSDPLPPLPYPNASFDLVYSLSVLTHMTHEAGAAWLVELVRLLKPGGLLLFTVHGERFLTLLGDAEAERFRAGEPVIAREPPELEGTNRFAAFHPAAYVTGELLPRLDADLIETVYEDPTGNGLTPMPVQDNYLVRKRGGTRFS